MSSVLLRALGWDHPRCMSAMQACADEWERRGRGTITWEARSLEAFGDAPLDEVARHYDLLVIDHPFCATAALAGCIRAFDDLLDAETLAMLDAGAVGPSQDSYRYEGKIWALASDAACQVTAFREDLLGRPAPTSWPDAMGLFRTLGVRAALPLSPAHAISSLLTLWAGAGLDPLGSEDLIDAPRGIEQLEWLYEMHRVGHPASTRWEPPQALSALVAGEVVYVPLTYGYVNYSCRSVDGTPCRFADIPAVAGSVLGGAGIAVSAASGAPDEAAAFAAWVSGEDPQRRIVAASGGQPASAACWSDPELDAESGHFYSATRATIEAAWVRPRTPWWPSFQLAAGRAITAALEARTPPPHLLDHLLELHHQTASRSAQTR